MPATERTSCVERWGREIDAKTQPPTEELQEKGAGLRDAVAVGEIVGDGVGGGDVEGEGDRDDDSVGDGEGVVDGVREFVEVNEKKGEWDGRVETVADRDLKDVGVRAVHTLAPMPLPVFGGHARHDAADVPCEKALYVIAEHGVAATTPAKQKEPMGHGKPVKTLDKICPRDRVQTLCVESYD